MIWTSPTCLNLKVDIDRLRPEIEKHLRNSKCVTYWWHIEGVWGLKLSQRYKENIKGTLIKSQRYVVWQSRRGVHKRGTDAHDVHSYDQYRIQKCEEYRISEPGFTCIKDTN